MRQILFRGKRIDNGEWVYGGYAQMGDKVFILPVIDLSMAKSFDWVKVIPESVGQFTGQQDSKGEYIYEGHILQYSYERDKSGTDVIEYTEVVEWETWKGITGFAIHNDMDREIIGNIYENTEMCSL